MRYPRMLLTSLPAALLMVSTMACGGESAPPPPPTAEVELGQKIYGRICATCHGADANGMPALGKGLRSNAFIRDLSDAEVVEFLKVGRSASDPLNETGIDMPPKGGDPSLTDDELLALVAYMRTL